MNAVISGIRAIGNCLFRSELRSIFSSTPDHAVKTCRGNDVIAISGVAEAECVEDARDDSVRGREVGVAWICPPDVRTKGTPNSIAVRVEGELILARKLRIVSCNGMSIRCLQRRAVHPATHHGFG